MLWEHGLKSDNVMALSCVSLATPLHCTCHLCCNLDVCVLYGTFLARTYMMYATCCRSRQEMAQAVHAVHQQVAEGSIAAADVTADTIEQELYTQVWLFMLTCFTSHMLGLPNETVCTAALEQLD